MAIFLQINCLAKMEFARTWAARKVISFSHSTFQNKCEEWTIISFNTEDFQCQNKAFKNTMQTCHFTSLDA